MSLPPAFSNPTACLRVVLLAAWALGGTMLAPLEAQAAEDDEPIAITVIQRDTLIGLGKRLFVDGKAWIEVARMNRLANPDRLSPGQVLQVPLRLLKWDRLDARFASLTGDVQLVKAGAAPRAAQMGDAVVEGDEVRVAPASSAVLVLADGSRVKLMPDSALSLTTHRSYGRGAGKASAAPKAEAAARPAAAASDAEASVSASPSDGWFAGAMRLLSGSVEVIATKLGRSKPLETRTSTAVIGVRGTVYRVGAQGEGTAAVTRTEVLEGAVRADAAQGQAGADVASGFGTAVDASGTAPQVRALMPAPDLAGVPERFERPTMRFASPAADAPLRVQVAADPAFEQTVSDQLIASGAEVRIAGLEDGAWHLRARRVDRDGIEGFDAQRVVQLKARPEPPATIAPRPGSKANLGPVELGWAANVQAQRYRLQVASGEIADVSAFERPVLEKADLRDTRARIDLPAAGVYQWRVASVRELPGGALDSGPWGDAQSFELKALPEPPQGSVGKDGALALNWGGRPQDRFQVELARDEAFAQVVARDELASPQWQVPPPKESGSYYFRYRSVEPDGWVSPPSSTLRVEVPKKTNYWWLMLLTVPLIGL